MKAVRTANTGPELLVRRLLHGMGYRYRLHAGDLPGKPDIVFRSRKKAIFVHGCFWHGHACNIGKPPKSRVDYWLPKIEKNRTRDKAATDRLHSMGWEALTVWQCELADKEALAQLLQQFLDRTERSTMAAESASVAAKGLGGDA